MIVVSADDWRVEGLCREVGGEVFYPEKGDLLTSRAAKAVCMRCPVIDQCGEYAISANELYGVWGGMSRRDRERLRARRNRAAEAAKEVA